MEVVKFTPSSPMVTTGVQQTASNTTTVAFHRRKYRPRSCRLQLTSSPCVRKVSVHLELLSANIKEILSETPGMLSSLDYL